MSKLRHKGTKQSVTTRRSGGSYWNAARLSRTERSLLDRVTALRSDIVRELRKYDDERLGLVADNVADSAELSIADLIGDLYLAEIDRDVRELHDVEGALQRIASGTYGTCIDCAQAIDPKRLEFGPHVARCLHCQQNAENALQPAHRPARL